MDPNEHEVGFIKSFMVPAKRERALELLSGSKTRQKQLDRLDHAPDLDPRCRVPIQASLQSSREIEALLRGVGAPDTAYVFSCQKTLDGSVLPLREALERVIGSGMGSVISCVPGELAYYEGEGPGERCILRRRAR